MLNSLVLKIYRFLHVPMSSMNDNWHNEIFFENQSAHLVMIQAGIKSYHPFKWHKDLQVAKSTDLPIAEPSVSISACSIGGRLSGCNSLHITWQNRKNKIKCKKNHSMCARGRDCERLAIQEGFFGMNSLGQECFLCRAHEPFTNLQPQRRH